MSKQGLAESMAAFIEVGIHSNSTGEWMYLGNRGGKVNPIEYFFSPDGFFAVWDKLDERKPKNTLKFYNYGNGECGCFLDEMDTIGPDRYTAFYSAVHEMTNQRSVEG